MGHAERLVYCNNKKDTQEFYKMLRKSTNDCFKIVSKSIVNQTWNAEWKNLTGVKISGYEIPFTNSTIFELEHSDIFYIPSADIDIPNHIIDKIQKTKPEQLKKESTYAEIQKNTFQSGEIFIWVAGNRGNIRDGYTLLGIDTIAIDYLYETYKNNEIDETFLKDGKINTEVALPYLCEFFAKKLYGEEKARIIKEVKVMDIDGLDNPDYILGEFFNHNYVE